MESITNVTDPVHLISDTELASPTSANAVTRAQAAALNQTTQSEPQLPQSAEPSNREDIDFDLYRQLTEEEVPSDQQWLQSTE